MSGSLDPTRPRLPRDEPPAVPTRIEGRPGPPPGAARDAPAQIGAYRILGELGRGGMGVVYRARRDDLEREFALKVVLPTDAGDPEIAERFRREARAAARLAGHAGIVGVFDLGALDDRLWFAMELVEGAPLDVVIDHGACSHAVMADLLEQTARALHFAHAGGVLHRDLKPANILVTGMATGAPVARITDFGLAMPLRADPAMQRITRTQMLIGTPAYMSPEQARGQVCDARSDVWALGATLYDCLVGRPPFEHESTYELLRQITESEPVPPRRRDPSVPVALETITLKCLEKDPERRYQTADALAADLARFRAGEALTARPVGAAGRWVRRVRRNPVPWLAAGAAALVLAIGGAGLGLRAWRLAGERQAAVAALLASGATHAAAHAEALAGFAAAAQALDADRATGVSEEKLGPLLQALAEARQRADAELAAAQAGYRGALALMASGTPNARHRTALEGLAHLAYVRLRQAEARGEPAAAARFERELGEADDALRALGVQRYARERAGDGRLTLDSRPSGARVTCRRYADPDGDGRLEAVEQPSLGVTPLTDVPLPRGSYLLILEADGCAPTRVPVFIPRAGHEVFDAPVTLLPPGRIGAGYVWVPPGRSILGSNAPDRNAAPRAAVWVDGFCLAEQEVTVGDYRAFLDAQLAAGTPEAAVTARLPRRDQSAGPYWHIADGHVVPDGNATDWPDTWPAIGVSWADAQAYCAWRSTLEGRVVRLPTAQEWERAYRGADGRVRPWGDGFDWTWLVGGRSPLHGGHQYIRSIRLAPGDVSPFGAADMAGSVFEWVADPMPGAPQLRLFMGGSWANMNAEGYRAPLRNAALPERVNVDLGFRVAADPRP